MSAVKSAVVSRRAAVVGVLAVGAAAVAGVSAGAVDALAEDATQADPVSSINEVPGYGVPSREATGVIDGPADANGRKQYGFLVRTEKCVNCGECAKACREAHGTPAGLGRREVHPFTSDFGKTVYVSYGCMQCAEPSCAAVCPAGAIKKRDDGIVVVNKDRCIGCKYCYEACPFGIPKYGESGMDKCDCCFDIGVAPGHEPYCRAACTFDALEYGELSALKIVGGELAVPVEAATSPSYLLM